MTGTIQIIANGGAKGMVSAKSREDFAEQVERVVPGAALSFSESGADVAQLVQDAIRNGAGIVAAAGGDGTVNAVATHLAGTRTALGVIPLGTLNHFSRDVGIPSPPDEALEVLRSGQAMKVDVGVVNERIFLNNSGLGLYPDMVFNRQRRQRGGASKWPAVFVESARAFARYRMLHLSIVIDGVMLQRRTPAVFVGNNDYSLAEGLAAARTELNEGELCLYVPHPASRMGLVWFSLRAFLGDPQPDASFDKLRASNFTIESRHKNLRVSIDGEVEVMQTPLKYSSRPSALSVMVPASSPTRTNTANDPNAAAGA